MQGRKLGVNNKLKYNHLTGNVSSLWKPTCSEKLSRCNNIPLWSDILDRPPSLTALNFAVWVAMQGRSDCISLFCFWNGVFTLVKSVSPPPPPPSISKWNRGMLYCQGKGLDARIARLKALYKMSLYNYPRKRKKT